MPDCRDDVDELLRDLQRQSEERTIELRHIAAQLPPLLGRRAMLAMLARDAVRNTNHRELVRRGSRKLMRVPTRIARSARSAWRNTAE